MGLVEGLNDSTQRALRTFAFEKAAGPGNQPARRHRRCGGPGRSGHRLCRCTPAGWRASTRPAEPCNASRSGTSQPWDDFAAALPRSRCTEPLRKGWRWRCPHRQPRRPWVATCGLSTGPERAERRRHGGPINRSRSSPPRRPFRVPERRRQRPASSDAIRAAPGRTGRAGPRGRGGGR